jgi:hypothetical protein
MHAEVQWPTLRSSQHKSNRWLLQGRFEHHLAGFAVVIDDQDPHAIESRDIGGCGCGPRSPAFA